MCVMFKHVLMLMIYFKYANTYNDFVSFSLIEDNCNRVVDSFKIGYHYLQRLITCYNYLYTLIHSSAISQNI